MPSMSTLDTSDIVTFKVIAIGTVFVLFAVCIGWLAHAAAGERLIREQARLNDMADESRALCEKWGMPAGSAKHLTCIGDIQAVRERHEKRIAEESEPF
jgi:hypothetical protein